MSELHLESQVKAMTDQMSNYEKRLAEKEYRITQLETKLDKVMNLMKQLEEDTYEVSSLKTRLINMECRIENLE